MILFIGSKDSGYFLEEISDSDKESFDYIIPNIHIAPQMPEILKKPDTTVMIFDIEQYEDDSILLADSILKLARSNNAKIIIYASGYIPQSKIIVDLYQKGIRNFILSTNLTDMKREYELCRIGFYESNGLDILENVQVEEIEKKESIKSSIKKIGIAGACSRIGTTTQCMQLIKDLMYRGYKACYIQMNDTSYLDEYLEDCFTSEERDDDIGRIRIEGIDHFYKSEKLPSILTQNYDYFIYDYGTYKDKHFNKTSFLEKDIRIFVVGSKPGEFTATRNLIDNMFYTESFYIFNLTPDNEKEDLLELMEEKSSVTFFSETAKDKYVLVNSDIYQKIVPADPVISKPEKKKHGFFKRRKKHAEI